MTYSEDACEKLPLLILFRKQKDMKDIDGEKLVQPIHNSANGNMLLPGRIAQKLAYDISNIKQQQESLTQETLKDITEREKEIIKWMVIGYTSKQIA